MMHPQIVLACCLFSVIAVPAALGQRVNYQQVHTMPTETARGCGGCHFDGLVQEPCYRNVSTTYTATYPCGICGEERSCTRIEANICSQPFCCDGYVLRDRMCHRECGHCCRGTKPCAMAVSLSSGKDTGIDAFGTKPGGRGFSWLKPLTAPVSGGDHAECSLQGVLQLDPPTDANSLTLHLTFINPFGWSFNLGDSPTNDGYAGDAGDLTHDYSAEIHNLGTQLKVWKNDLQDPLCDSTEFYSSVAGAVTTELTIRVSQHQLCIYNAAGVLLYEGNSACLFKFDRMYLGLNRVIMESNQPGGGAHQGRVGTGLCSVCGYWSKSKVSDM